MAKKRISKNEIAEKGLFDNVTQGAKEARAEVKILTEAIKVLKETAKKLKDDVGGAKVDDTKGMKNFDQMTRQANSTAKAKLTIDKQLLHQKARLSEMQKNQNKQIRTTIEATQKLTKEQKKSLGTLQKLELSSKKLRAERAKLNLETTKGKRRLKEINRELDKNNAKIRASGDAMKKQRLNVGNYSGAIGKLTGMLAKLGIGFGVFNLLKGAFNVVKDFEQSQANLASVLGVNTTAMAKLTEQAKKLGATTTFTASQVAELHLEFAKLGFTQSQIEGMTESTLLLAEATGSELGESASVVGATMRGFGMDVSETQRVVDVMAKSFSSSSLDMAKFSTSMSTVAPIAKLAGLNIEQTTALIGTLTDRGIDASTAGTGLKNMFLQANKAGLTFSEAIEKVKNASDQTGTSMKLFGTRGASLGVILANNEDQVESLTRQLYASDNAAKQMAETQRNTLGGSIKLLTSAWEGWILKQNEAGGASDKLRDAIDWLSENIETVLNWVMFAVKQFVLFKGAIMATKLATMAFNAVTLVTAKSMKGLVSATKKMDKGMKTNAIGALVSLLIQLVFWIHKAVTAESKLQKEQRERKEVAEELRKAEKEEQDQLNEGLAGFKAMVAILKRTNAGSKERKELIDKINDKYGTTIKNIKDESLFMSELNVQVEAYIKLQKTRFLQDRNQKKLTAQLIKQVEAEEKIAGLWLDLEKRRTLKGESGYDPTIGGNRLFEFEETDTQLLSRFQGQRGELEKWQKQLDQATKTIDQLGNDAVELVTVTFTPEEEIGSGSTSGSSDIDKQISLIRQIEDAQIKLVEDAQEREDLARAQRYINSVKDMELKKTDNIEFDTWKKLQQKLLNKDLTVINNKYEAQKKAIREKSILAQMKNSIIEKEIQLDSIADIYENYEETEALRREIDLDRIALISEKAKFDVDNTKLSEGEKALIITESLEKITEIEKQALERKKQHDDTSRLRLKDKFTEAENEKYLELLKSSDTQEQISEKLLNFQIEQLEELIKIYKEKYPLLTKEITEMETSLEEKKRELNKSELKATLDHIKEMEDLRRDSIQALTDYSLQMTDKRIAKIQEETDAHKKMADELAELAKNGNITAKESLAEENRLIAESERKKAEMEKRKQRIQLISSILLAYNANLEQGTMTSTEALSKAFLSKEVMDSFISSIGSFYDGSEDIGTTSNPLDSKGGRLVLAHNNERIMTAKQNSMMGNVSNDEVARVMEDRRLGRLVDGNQVAVGWENIALIEQLNNVTDKLDMVNKTIENKPEIDIRLGQITQKTMEIVETKRKGGLKTVSTFKVKAQ